MERVKLICDTCKNDSFRQSSNMVVPADESAYLGDKVFVTGFTCSRCKRVHLFALHDVDNENYSGLYTIPGETTFSAKETGEGVFINVELVLR